MAIRLKQEGFYDFTIFERGDTVGGVWRANTYPGATCDVPSHLYSFSFAPGGHWSRRYAPRADIIDYLENLVEEFGLGPHLRLGTDVDSADFDPETGAWSLALAGGGSERFDAVVTACGQLTNPATPEIEGQEKFSGPSFHSAEWDHDVAFEGKRVAVIGTGASAIQFVPRIAEVTSGIDVYQRSAPWILPKMDRGYPRWEQALMRRFPSRAALARAGVFGFIEFATYAFTGTDWVAKPFTRIADGFREKELPDPELRAKATPDYALGCKRVLFTNEWYPALMRSDVELHADGVERITANGVVGGDGVERPADVIVWGTGFQSQDFVAPMAIRGLDGSELDEVWGDRPEAYLGTVVSGFPNLFVMYGPNTNHGSGSVPYTLECQYNLTIDALRELRRGSRYLDLKPEVQRAWREEIEERSAGTRWITGGSANWYLNDAGVNTNNWPGDWREFKRRTATIDRSDYIAA
jgi:cation diffusion facilitator CzcD-associated flavoprotein CzcO